MCVFKISDLQMIFYNGGYTVKIYWITKCTKSGIPFPPKKREKKKRGMK